MLEKKWVKSVRDYKFKNKVAIVTGASKGIGRHLVLRLLNKGVKVVGLARSKDLLNSIALEVRVPERFLGLTCDLTNPDDIVSAVSSVREHFGFIDILINNAGLGLAGPLLETKAESISKCFDLNFFSTIRCIQQIAPEMVERKRGCIVNIASIAAKFGLPTLGIYSASKSALASYSQALRIELAPMGIHVLTVFPGNTDTAFHKDLIRTKDFSSYSNPRKQMSPDFVAEKIISSIQKRKAEVVLGRSALILNVLKTLTPRLLEVLLRKEMKIDGIYEDGSSNKPTEPLNFVDECLESGDVSLLGISKPCQYHQSADQANNASVTPKGLSPSLYYFLYPYLLAMTYGGKFSLNSIYRNPLSGEGGPVTIKCKSPPLSERIKNLVKTLLAPFIPLGRIKVAPEISTAKGFFPFDLGKDGTLCPASFRSFFPSQVYHHLKDKKYGTKTPWKVSCPDHLKHHTFGNKEGVSSEEEFISESVCNWGDNIKIKNTGSCSSGLKNEAQNLDAIIKPLGFRCASLLNVMYGYYLTLAKGGELAFYSKTFDAGIAQCPCTKSRVVVEITRKKKTIEFKTIDVIGGECPKGIRKGDTVSLPIKVENNNFCLDAFNSLFLSAGLAEFAGSPLKASCVTKSCAASWEISYNNSQNLATNSN